MPEVAHARAQPEVPVRVLVVDDEAGVRNAMARILRGAGMHTVIAEDGAAALEILERERFDVALIDVRMPAMTGPQLLSRMKAARYPTEVVMMTAFADVATTVAAMQAGAHAFITKPFGSNEAVVIEVLNAAAHKRLTEEAERLRGELALAIGAGEAGASRSPPPLRSDTRELRRTVPVSVSVPVLEGEQTVDAEPLDAIAQALAPLALHELAYAEAKRRVVEGFTDLYVGALLRTTEGNLSEAARRSGLDRSNFRRLLRVRRIRRAG